MLQLAGDLDVVTVGAPTDSERNTAERRDVPATLGLHTAEHVSNRTDGRREGLREPGGKRVLVNRACVRVRLYIARCRALLPFLLLVNKEYVS